MADRRVLRLPGILTLMALSGLVWLGPLALSAVHEVEEVTEQVEAADDVSESAGRLGRLLRLAPVLAAEKNATAGLIGMSSLPVEIPDVALAAVGLDYEAHLAESHAATDEILEDLLDHDLERLVILAREANDGGEDALETSAAAYDEVVAELGSKIETVLTRLNGALGRTTAQRDLVHAAHVAEATAAVEVAAAERLPAWVPLVVPFAAPSLADVRTLSDALSRYEDSARHLDEAVEAGHPTAEAWAFHRGLTETALLDQRLEATVVELLGAGLPFETAGEFDPDSFDVDAMIEEVNIISDTQALDDEVNASLALTMDEALNEVFSAAGEIRSAAAETRNSALLTLGALALGMLVIGLVLAFTITRPLRRVANAARALSNGELDTVVAERGPREIRMAARAMNEATGSLRLVERKAVALTEERLEDPVLEESVPGELGSSIQQAVDHLAEALTERERFQTRLTHEATHDSLTGLANRNAVLKHASGALARSRRSKSSMALLFLDLDGFKAINDIHGHHTGDQVLKVTASRIRDALREGDLAVRIGGDEFLVVAEPVTGIDDVVDLARRILDDVAEPVFMEQQPLSVSASVGIALADLDLNADELLRDADLAVYRAKELGRGRIEVCDEDLRRQVVRRTTLANAIEQGLERDEFVLHYQPIVDAVSQQVTAVEALLRWEHPSKGLRPPAAFMDVAERSNLVVDLDRFALRSAAAQIDAWAEHPVLADLPVSVNISARHLSSGRLRRSVVNVLDERPRACDRLVLEITETALVEDLEVAATDLNRLRTLGVQIALDDFGTGFMSLANLRRLPVDALKIDRSFVSDMETATDHSLIELIVSTGHLLEMTVTAEGVETVDQQHHLVAMGCDTLQGYLFSRPVTVADLERRLEADAGYLRGDEDRAQRL